nr:MAG TPA: hypothetical protein [Caudoviricetes sp.]
MTTFAENSLKTYSRSETALTETSAICIYSAF